MTIIRKENRTQSYVCTVTDRNDPAIVAFREGVKMYNRLRNEGEKRQYVKLQARGHRHGIRRYHQSLPLDLGTYFDVYVYERW